MMKRFLFAAISICIAASAVAAPMSAYALGLPEPEYPEIFDDSLPFSRLTDFAVANDDLMVFADGQTIIYWENENVTVYGSGENGKGYTFDANVTNVDYDSASRHFYYSLDGGKTGYILPDSPDELPGETAKHDFSAPHITETSREFNGYIYYYGDDGLIAIDKEAPENPKTLNLNNAKIYGGKLYGILSTSLLYEIKGLDAERVEIHYSNYDKLTTISAGDIPEKLNTYTTFSENPQLVQIERTAYLTEIDANNLTYTDESGNAYISVIEPKKLHESLRGNVALLLYESDKVRIVAYSRSAYILSADGASNLNYDIKTPVEAGTTATVNVVGEYAHSLPYMCNATRTFALAPNEIVTVISKVSNEGIDALAHTFYLVENAKGERGYVIDEFLGDLNVPVPDEGDANVTPDPNPNTSNRVKTVVLVIVIILLLLVVIGYIIWVFTSKHQKKIAANKDGEIDLNDTNNENKE